MSTHVIIGASGQVGEHLSAAALSERLDVVGCYCRHSVPGMQQLDIRDSLAVFDLVRSLKPAVVHLPASMANVDYCEEHPQETYAANVLGVKNVVDAVNKVGARLVYFSSDYIFDGTAGPYSEDDPANPICEYGRQKVYAEHYVALNCRDYVIVRTTVVYGFERQGKNFIYRLINTLKSGNVLKVPVDQIGSPTYAPELARAAVRLAQGKEQGVFHVVGSQLSDRYEFALEAARVFGLDESLIEAVPTSQLSQRARRPLAAGMLVEKVSPYLDFCLSGYKEGLRAMKLAAREENLIS